MPVYMRSVMMISGLVVVLGLATYPIIFYPKAHPEYYRKPCPLWLYINNYFHYVVDLYTNTAPIYDFSIASVNVMLISVVPCVINFEI